MKNFPVFTTDWGVASLTLKEIPYRREAYIHIQTVQPGFFGEHLAECVSFCRIAGAEKVYATGSEELEAYPVHASIYEMRGVASLEEEQLKQLWPVTEETVDRWMQICNERMRSVDHAGTLEQKDREKILSCGGAYFIHDRGQLLGIGWLEENTLKAIASAVPGMGKRVAHTLLSVMPGVPLRLEVASSNEKAIRLYESLGMLKTAELERWYEII